MPNIIQGKDIAQALCIQLGAYVAQLKVAPGLAVILIGEDPASAVYVKNKIIKTKSIGMQSFDFRLPKHITQTELLELIQSLNARSDIHGILLQLPLPDGLDATEAIMAINPLKDVDGLHPLNAGLLANAEPMRLPEIVPCTPLGCLMLIRIASRRTSFEGLSAVIVGRSRLVGKPLAHLLLLSNATVTLAHSKTAHLSHVCQTADILVAAIGKAHFIGADHVKEGALVIDVGINRQPDGHLVGDVDFEAVYPKVSAITPVPGGVGPMTIACLLYNTVRACSNQMNIPFDFQFQFGHS